MYDPSVVAWHWDVADEGIAWGRADSPVQAVREALAVLGIEVPE